MMSQLILSTCFLHWSYGWFRGSEQGRFGLGVRRVQQDQRPGRGQVEPDGQRRVIGEPLRHGARLVHVDAAEQRLGQLGGHMCVVVAVAVTGPADPRVLGGLRVQVPEDVPVPPTAQPLI